MYEDIEFIEDLIKISQDDLKASKILHSKKLYPQSIYFLQQSIEKANKSFALLTGISKDKEELQSEISHDSLKIHKRALKQQEGRINKFESIKENYPGLEDLDFLSGMDLEGYRENLDEANFFIRNIRRSSMDSISKDDISKAVEELNDLEREISERKNKDLDLKEQTKNVKEQLGQFIEFFEGKDEVDEEEINKLKSEIESGKTLEGTTEKMIDLIPEMLEASYINVALFYLSSIIPEEHSNETRYPDGKVNPHNFYTESSAIVKNYTDLIEVLEKTLEKLQKIFDNVKSAKNKV